MEYALTLILVHILIGKVCSSNDDLTCSFEENFCGWINDGWQRKTGSGLSTSGPSSAADGSTYYIQINTTKLEHYSIIKSSYQRTSGTSCLKFKYHLFGQDVEHLSYGYYTNPNNYQEINRITERENFWHCATFELSNPPDTATGIYFRGKSGVTQFSIIGLDSITYNTGNDCSSSQECPVPPTKTPTTQPSTTTGDTATKSAVKQDEKWIIIGAGCGGVVVLVVILVTVCIIKKRKRSACQFISKTTTPQTRALPLTPLDKDEPFPTIGESYNRKFSVKPTHAETNGVPQSVVESPIDRTSQVYHSITEDTTPYDFGYIQVPPDYDIDDKSSIKSEGSDYLVPKVGLNSQNQYESDPTEKGNLKCTDVENNHKPSLCQKEIPAIPVMTEMKMPHASLNENEIDEDYDDAIVDTTTDGNEQTSEGDNDSNTNGNEKDDYLDMADNVSNVSDDYITPISS